MCGRVVQVSDPIRLSIVDGLDVRDSRLSNYPRRWNGAPSQELLVIRENHKTGERSLDLLTWGLIPYWCTDPKGGRKPINAKSETVATLPTFKDAYRRRRCILPVDAFYEWKASKGGKQPYAIATKDRSPFGIAGIWENWKNPDGEWVRTFAILTPLPMKSSARFTIACRRCLLRRPTIAGSELNPIRGICYSRSHQNSWRSGRSRPGSTRHRTMTSSCSRKSSSRRRRPRS
jgi:putative SOS response-associated peptidase YedK